MNYCLIGVAVFVAVLVIVWCFCRVAAKSDSLLDTGYDRAKRRREMDGD